MSIAEAYVRINKKSRRRWTPLKIDSKLVRLICHLTLLVIANRTTQRYRYSRNNTL